MSTYVGCPPSLRFYSRGAAAIARRSWVSSSSSKSLYSYSSGVPAQRSSNCSTSHSYFAASLSNELKSKIHYTISAITLSLLNFREMDDDFEFRVMNMVGLEAAKFGVILTLLGLVLFSDKTLLAAGNAITHTGAIMANGLEFFELKNYMGSILVLFAFVLIILGWPFTGLVLETCGCAYLLSEFWGPPLANFLRKLPLVGSLLPQSPRAAPANDTPSPTPDSS